MSYPPNHPMRRASSIVRCPHCDHSYPSEDGPQCTRCGGMLSRYNTRAKPLDTEKLSPEAIFALVKETRRTIDEDWYNRLVITFE